MNEIFYEDEIEEDNISFLNNTDKLHYLYEISPLNSEFLNSYDLFEE